SLRAASGRGVLWATGRGVRVFLQTTNYNLQTPLSIPLFPIDDIPERFAGEVAAEVVGEEVNDVVADVGGGVGVVGDDGNAGCVPEGVVVGQRLFGVRVEECAGELSAAEGVEQWLFLDDLAARDVDQIRAGLDGVQFGRADHALGLRRQRAGDHQIVGFGQHREQIRRADDPLK